MSGFNIIKQLLSVCKQDTYANIILSIFDKMPYGTDISKRELEKRFGLSVSFKYVNMRELGNSLINCKTNDEALMYLMLISKPLPGDLQRALRLFYDEYRDYGLKQRGKNSSLCYYWEPISQEEYDKLNGVIRVPRNIFKTDTDRDNFVSSKDSKCEICKSNKGLAVDHWRAYSVYKMDTSDIAVLLCEDCNNIHHNFDASKILKHKKENYLCVKRWIEVEKRIRSLGYMPNEEDKKTQNEMIDFVVRFCLDNEMPVHEELFSMKH